MHSYPTNLLSVRSTTTYDVTSYKSRFGKKKKWVGRLVPLDINNYHSLHASASTEKDTLHEFWLRV